MRAVIIPALIVVLTGWCDGKDRNGLSGTRLDTAVAEAYLGEIQPGVRSRNYDFSPGANDAGLARRSLIFAPAYAVRETYVIEAAGQRYVASRIYESDKPSSISELTDVKFAIVKKKVFILDRKGREHEFRLLTSRR
jgi:hypothetical protein